MTHFFEYAGIQIEYQLYRKKVKNINLRISAQGEIMVSASKTVPFEIVQSFIQSKGEWIIQHMAKMEKMKLSQDDNCLKQGKELFFLGERYQLNILEEKKNAVSLDTSEKIISIKAIHWDNPEELKKIYMNWLRKQAEVHFQDILEDMYPRVEAMGIKKPLVTIRNMRTIWGSCSYHKNKICLNLQLIKAAQPCIEQVVLHELCHFQYPNHGKGFYTMLEGLMPDWKRRKELLEKEFQDGIR